MKRTLEIKQGIISDDTVRDILEVFPEIESKFRRRKTYDEYYFDGAIVELNIDLIEDLTKLGFTVTINWESVII